jgi:hypothetical protein
MRQHTPLYPAWFFSRDTPQNTKNRIKLPEQKSEFMRNGKGMFNLARQARDRLMQIPRKLAPEIVATVTSDPDARTVETFLEDAIREALEELTQ